MAYTPKLSYQSSCTLRRIAWALNIPMTKAIERTAIKSHYPNIFSANLEKFFSEPLFPESRWWM